MWGAIMRNFNKSLTRNILLVISYDGTRYSGWQVQKNAITVQEMFQVALKNVLKEDVDIKGCSRTDSKVHANMYCVNFKTSSRIGLNNIICAMNRFLPDDICVKKSFEVDEDFHARYSCTGKEYVYKIWNHKIRNPFMHNYALHYWYSLDCELLNSARNYFIGNHDFTSFATLDKRNTQNMIRNIYDFSVTKQNDLVEIKISANGFLYNMVRIIVGTLLRIAQNKIKIYDIPEIINKKNRAYAGPTAPPHGLYLNKVYYDNIKLETE